jgi:putative ABC transport system permease protein
MKLIDFLLRLYPAEFRARYGREVREYHEARVRESQAPVGRIIVDHFVSAVREQLHAVGPDVKYALRSLAARPAFAAVVILTIALGVGANGAVFSIVNGVLLKSLPYPEAERVIAFRHEPTQWLISEPQYALYRDQLTTLESFAAFSRTEGNLATETVSERIGLVSATPNLFATLRVQPMLGRGFGEADVARPSAVVVLSHALWARAFASDSGIVGKTLTLGGVKRTVIGVMPASFKYPDAQAQMYLPICTQRACESLTKLAPNEADGWVNHYLSGVGRLRPGVSVDDLRLQANGLARRIMREHAQYFDPAGPLTPHINTLRDETVGATRPYLVALFGAVIVILLIVCANVANLLLARGNSRQRELALRAAIGASRRRIVLQLLTESLVMSAIGGLAGLALAWGGTRVLVWLAPESLPRLDQVQVDGAVVLFSLAVSIAAGMIFGIVPALRHARHSPADVLRSGGKGTAMRGGSNRTRGALVVAEVGLAVVLMTGAGMLVRSLVNLQETDIGFRPAGALTAKVSLTQSAYNNDQSIQYFTELLQRVRAVPGVQSAGAARWLPVVDAGGLWDVAIDGKSFPTGQAPAAVPQEVTPGWFSAMGMSIVTGRDFAESDWAEAPLVAIISEAMSTRYWPEGNPLGKRFRLGSSNAPWVTIVGVVRDLRARGPADAPEPTMYYPFAQVGKSGYFVPRSMSLVVRTQGDPLALTVPVRAAVAAADRTVPVSNVRTLEDVVATATANRSFSTTLIANFALLALLLAAIGIYGVMSYSVSERSFEIGVRMALGAERAQVLAMILGGGVRLALIGVAIGLVGALAMARGIRSMLVGVPAVDVTTMFGAALALCGVAALAAFIPARRATRVQPTDALRSG